MSFYTGAVKLLGGIVKAVYQLEIHGADSVPKEGRYLVVSNHISLGDVIVLAVSCKRPIHFMAKKELFKIPVLSQIIRGLGAFPVDRHGSAHSALKTAMAYLNDEKLVGIFPQGTRSRQISVADTDFKSGAAMCACKTGSGIIPVFIQTKGQHFKLFGKTHVYFGNASSFDMLPYNPESENKYKDTTEYIKNEIFKLEIKAYGGKFNEKH